MLLSNWNLDGKKQKELEVAMYSQEALYESDWVQIVLHSELQPAGLNRESVREKGQIIRLKKNDTQLLMNL